jgi:hypothetical protein
VQKIARIQQLLVVNKQLTFFYQYTRQKSLFFNNRRLHFYTYLPDEVNDRAGVVMHMVNLGPQDRRPG